MTTELIVFLMLAVMVAGIMLGHPVAFSMAGTAVLFAYLCFGPKGSYILVGRMYDSVTNNVLIAIPLFILMASFLEKSGIAEDLFTAIMHLFGPLNGGLALAVVALCVIFAATTGIMGATVVSMSLMSMPIMLKRGYSIPLASGTVAAGGCLGILIPPSIMLVMMADQSGLSVGRLFAGAFVPGVLLGILFFIYVLTLSFFKPQLGPAMPLEERRRYTMGQKLKMLSVSLVPPMILILGVLGSIWLGYATPTEASGVGAFLAMLLMVIYRRFSWKAFIDCMFSALRTNCMVMATLVGASIFTSIFLGIGGGRVVTNMIMAFSGGGKWAVFLIMMVIVFIAGFFIDWIGIIYITFPIFLPIAVSFGFDKLWFIIALAVNLQMSFLTPPFGYALFYLKGTVPPEVKLKQIYRGVAPYIGLQMIGLAIVVLFPILATYLPELFFGAIVR